MTQPSGPTPFRRVDDTSPAERAALARGLDRTAAAPGIRLVRQVADEMLGLRPGQHVLDAGCGLGEVARQIAAIVAPTGDVVGLDASQGMIDEARSRHDGSRVRYQVGDMTDLPFTEFTFDRVRSERVLQHLEDPDQAVRELVRVTRRGGRLCLVDTDWESLVVDGMSDDVLAPVRQAMLDGHGDVTRMGRTLRRRLVRAGVSDVTARPVTMAFDHPLKAADVVVLFNRDLPPGAGPVPEHLREPFQAAADEAGARREFLAALTIWVAVGKRR
jgi:SAM-dependent methyltransferase